MGWRGGGDGLDLDRHPAVDLARLHRQHVSVRRGELLPRGEAGHVGAEGYDRRVGRCGIVTGGGSPDALHVAMERRRT
jgi:hypothetical protein